MNLFRQVFVSREPLFLLPLKTLAFENQEQQLAAIHTNFFV